MVNRNTLLAMYTIDLLLSDALLEIQNYTIFGAGRLGIYDMASHKVMYELSDHLGNTRAVVAADVDGNAETVSYTDYYPHGGIMPGRNFVNSLNFPFAYQGQEKDAETNLINFELRQYDARLGRWYNPDPMGQHHSPYLAMSNNPVSRVDPTGGVDFYIDDQKVSESTYNNYVGMSGANIHLDYGGLGVGTNLGYSYDGKNYYGKYGAKNAYDARDQANMNWLSSIGVNKGNDGYYTIGSMYKDDKGHLTTIGGIGGEASAYLYSDAADYYGLSTKRASSNYKESWSDKLDNALGSLLFGTKENYKAVQKNAGDNNPYMYTYQEMQDAAATEAEIASMFIPVGEIFQGLKWAGRGIGLLSKAENRVFWSGGEKAMEAAARFAHSTGRKTLEMTIGGRVMSILNPVLPRSVSAPIWRVLSRNFAKGAEGSVQFFRNGGIPRTSSIWETVERPILENNGVNIIFN